MFSQDSKDELIEIEQNKHSFITFAKLNKYFLIPFFSPICCMLTNFFLRKIISTNIIKNQELLKSIFIELSYIFGGLLHFISYFRPKTKKIDKIKLRGIQYIYNGGRKNYKKYELILFITFLGSLLSLIGFIAIYSQGKNVFNYRLYFLVFIPLFSKFILKENIYKHQYLSIIVAIFGAGLLFIPVCLEIGKDDIIPNILKFFYGVIYSLFIVLIKYMINQYYISPLILSLLFGIISIFLTSIAFIISSLIKYNDLSIFNNLVDFSETKNEVIVIIYIILAFLFAIALQVFTLLSLFYFSPNLTIITDTISPMLTWIVETIQNYKSMIEVIVNPIGYLIVLFSSLIYNEIIILNFWGLSKNTKIFVEQRVNKEEKQIEDANLSDSNQNNDMSLNSESNA